MKTIKVENTKDTFLKGLNKAADIITSSMGPKGNNVIINNNGNLLITKDGVSIAKSINFPDPIENVGAKILISAAQETVKQTGDGPQPLYSKVLTPKGFVTMGSLRKGDIICGTNNTHQRVLEVYPKGKKEIYEVKFMDGRVVECCSDHLWTVQESNKKIQTMTTREMINSNKILTIKPCGSRQFGFFTPRTSVEFEQQKLPLDPYLIGLFIGDGSISGKTIRLSLGKSKQYILDRIPNEHVNNIKWIENKNVYRVSFSTSIIPYLKQAGIYGTYSYNKFIPKKYLYSSIKQRKALLQGLLDTDGHINKRGRFEYSTISKQLRDDFIELTRSLNIQTCKRKIVRKKIQGAYSDGISYVITELKGYKSGNKIVSISPTGKYTEMQCILVSNPDHLYITDNYIVTHNTTLTSLLLQQMLNTVDTKEDLKKLTEEVNQLKEYIKQTSKEVSSTKDIYNIAKTSSNSTYIAQLIESIYKQTSLNVHIELERTEEKETYITVDKGLKINTGFDHNWQITNNFTQEAIYENPNFYITHDPIHHPSQKIKDVVKIAMQHDVPLVFIADKYSRQFISFIQNQVIHKKAKLLTLRMSEFFGEDKFHQIENIKTYISKDQTALSIKSNPYYTIIKSDDHNNIEQRLKELKSLSNNALDPLETKNFTKLYNQLSQNIATIWVGGNTKEEIKELYDRVEDAIGATKAATEQGYNIGMGKSFFDFVNLHSTEFDNIWHSPMLKILDNASINFEKLKNSKVVNKGVGIDLGTKANINLLEEGIVDPTKSLLIALDNALANTKLVINTKYILYNEIQESGQTPIYRR